MRKQNFARGFGTIAALLSLPLTAFGDEVIFDCVKQAPPSYQMNAEIYNDRLTLKLTPEELVANLRRPRLHSIEQVQSELTSCRDFELNIQMYCFYGMGWEEHAVPSYEMKQGRSGVLLVDLKHERDASSNRQVRYDCRRAD